MNKNIQGDFQFCISVPLNKNKKIHSTGTIIWIQFISFIEYLVSIEMKKKSFEVLKSFINEDFSDRFLFCQLMKQQLILALHLLFHCNQKSTL